MSGTKSLISAVAISFFTALVILAALSSAGFQQLTISSILLSSAFIGVVSGGLVSWLLLGTREKAESGRADVNTPKSYAFSEETTITDPLTGIMNRHGITISVLDAMSLGERYGHPLTIALLDIDHLRNLNIEYGRDFGDQVLATVAGIIADSLRMPDKVGRFMGQQFLIVLPHTDIEDAKAIADRTRALIADYDFDAGGQRVKLTTSVGVTQYQQNEDLEALLSRAGEGIEQARQSGRNKIAIV
ncbi:MAG: GGDEF domain-containing protein [Acidiferrobacterales bacterium]